MPSGLVEKQRRLLFAQLVELGDDQLLDDHPQVADGGGLEDLAQGQLDREDVAHPGGKSGGQQRVSYQPAAPRTPPPGSPTAQARSIQKIGW